MARVLLIRHGESLWNAEGRWQGQADPPLTDLGRRQAIAAAQRLGVVDEIVASTLERALETAMLVSDQLGIGPVHPDPRLRERHAGEWQGLTRAEIDAGWPGFLGSGRRPDGWEPDEELLVRVLAALIDLAATVGTGDALVFTHGGVIRAVERAFDAKSPPIENLGGRWLEFDGTEIEIGERVVLIDPDEVEVTIPGQI
jgi:broad specificity phosphatase PhoE